MDMLNFDLFSDGEWKKFNPQNAGSIAENFKSSTRFLLYLTAASYYMRRDSRVGFAGAVALAVLLARYQIAIDNDEKDDNGDESRRNNAAKTLLLKRSTTNPREQVNRGAIVPTLEEERKGAGRPVQIKEPGPDVFKPLFGLQTPGPMKFVSTRRF
jgi:hypothetical protein